MTAFTRSGLALAALTLAVSAGPVPTRPPNDDFAERKALPSAENVNVPVGEVAGISVEPLDPLAAAGYEPSWLQGTLWWSWQAPRDGWFIAESPSPEPEVSWRRVFVFEGQTIESLIPVQNGNDRGLAFPSHRTIFEAKQGQTFVIGMLGFWVADLPPGGGTGSLVIRPAAGPPANETLATRQALTGNLPLTAVTSNLAGAAQEIDLVRQMQSLTRGCESPARLGAVVWYEWRCPESGRYWLKSSGGVNAAGGEDTTFYAAARRTLDDGTPAAPGDWSTSSLDPAHGTFEAKAGRVYDIALATQAMPWDYAVASYDEITFTLDRWPAEPLNTAPENAFTLPAALPLDATIELRPGALPPDDERIVPVQLWWKYTAPEDGLYEVLTSEYAVLHHGTGLPPADRVILLRGGEDLRLEFQREAWRGSDVRVRITKVPVPANDNLAQAPDLGSAFDFRIAGHRDLATMEPGEPLRIENGAAKPTSGSLWWRWTAPANGWLSETSSERHSTRELFRGSSISTLQRIAMIAEPAAKVERGVTYLIRAAFDPGNQSNWFRAHVVFEPASPADGWASAVNLGVTDRPSFRPSIGVHVDTYPVFRERWFKWTARTTGLSHVFASSLQQLAIFTDPASGTVLAPVVPRATFALEAGRTYWIRLRTDTGTVWFSAQPTRLAVSGDISSAAVLGPSLPASGAASFLGDTNSPAEIAALPGVITVSTPAIWWKWQAPDDQWVRLAFRIFGSYNIRGTQVFGGDLPSAGNTVETRSTLEGRSGLFFKARRNQTYWIVAVNDSGPAGEDCYASVELRPVRDAAPANDNFQDAAVITQETWDSHNGLYNIHSAFRNDHPLYYESVQASAEPGEPPLALIIGDDGNSLQQTMSTWWKWTAPASGIFKIALHRITGETFASRPPRDDPPFVGDLTANIYSGDSLASLSALTLYEPVAGEYFFRAEQGTRYSIRVASSDQTSYYHLVPLAPSAEDIYNFWAVENLMFDEVGRGSFDDAGDGVPNFVKLIFGLDLDSDYRSPVNNAVRGNLPHVVENPAFFEFRFRPLPHLLPEGNPAVFNFYGQGSTDLKTWEWVPAEAAGNGELSVRLPKTGDRGFLKLGLSFGYWMVEIHN